jgi:hypothetical protein
MFISTMAAVGLLFACGCASQTESVNQGANQAGQAAGGVMRLPNSVSEGAAQGVAGQPSPNPYGR